MPEEKASTVWAEREIRYLTRYEANNGDRAISKLVAELIAKLARVVAGGGE